MSIVLQTFYNFPLVFSKRADIVIDRLGKPICQQGCCSLCPAGESTLMMMVRGEEIMYYDRSDPLKNTEEVPSIGEGQLMQPVDEQPFGPSADQQPHDEP